MSDIFEFLQTLSADTPSDVISVFESLYSCSWTALAVFQSLPALAKQVVMRLLLLSEPVEAKIVLSWVKPDAVGDLKSCIAKVESLQILLREPRVAFVEDLSLAAVGEAISIRPIFRSQMMKHLSSSGDEKRPWALQAVDTPLKPEVIERFAATEWQSILNFMATNNQKSSNKEIVTLLQKAGLLEFKASAAPTSTGSRVKMAMTITPAGYRFMMKDVHVQLWTFVASYMSAHLVETADKVGLLSLLFQLSFCTVGDCFGVEDVPEALQPRLLTLASFGMVVIDDDLCVLARLCS